MLNLDSNNSTDEVKVEAECKNYSHDISLHTPRCSERYMILVAGHNQPDLILHLGNNNQKYRRNLILYFLRIR